MTILHYVGANDDRGGIVSVIRALAAAGRCDCVLGVNRGFVPRRAGPLPTAEFPRVEPETINVANLWRARRVAQAVLQTWLREPDRIFHGHSRAGLLAALWLHRWGERRVVVSVHCYGRQRWFYRWAAGQLGDRLYWLSPAMKRYYGVGDAGAWEQCIPGCIEDRAAGARVRPAGAGVRLGGIGMLVGWKRWGLVLEAMARLPGATRDRLRFLHIGAPADTAESRRYARQLRHQTEALGLVQKVEWRGEQPDADGLLAEVDCLVVASRHEPLSIAMLEALRAGVPVLAARSGGNCDVLTPPRNGWFFEPNDVVDCARALAMLVETDALRRAEVRPDDLVRFRAETVAAQWQAAYARL